MIASRRPHRSASVRDSVSAAASSLANTRTCSVVRRNLGLESRFARACDIALPGDGGSPRMYSSVACAIVWPVVMTKAAVGRRLPCSLRAVTPPRMCPGGRPRRRPASGSSQQPALLETVIPCVSSPHRLPIRPAPPHRPLVEVLLAPERPRPRRLPEDLLGELTRKGIVWFRVTVGSRPVFTRLCLHSTPRGCEARCCGLCSACRGGGSAAAKTPYTLLGVPKDATTAEVKLAFFQKAARPSRPPTRSATRRRISRAERRSRIERRTTPQSIRHRPGVGAAGRSGPAMEELPRPRGHAAALGDGDEGSGDLERSNTRRSGRN